MEQKDTLYHAQLDFYRLSKPSACDSQYQHIEMIREIPESFAVALLTRAVARKSAAA
jgi:hypothetical protein